MDVDDLVLFERSLAHATGSHTGPALDAALDDLGWDDALPDDRRAAVSTLFELQGAACATSSALDRVMIHALGVNVEARVAVLPRLGGWGPPGAADRGGAVHGLAIAGFSDHDVALVVAPAGEKAVAATVATADLTLRPVHGIDPWLGLVEVTGAPKHTEIGPADWQAVAMVAQLALGHELVGASRTMLELARKHALERVQFGQPISSFQAVRHRLADALVAIETAAAALDAAWLDGSAQSAAMGKALAGRGARIAARHCQQVLAGIGFTTEHDLHRFVRRILVLDELFGSARSLTRDLGECLLVSRRLPPLLPL